MPRKKDEWQLILEHNPELRERIERLQQRVVQQQDISLEESAKKLKDYFVAEVNAPMESPLRRSVRRLGLDW
jgi:hypothetical protein